MFKTYDNNENETTFLKNHLIESSTIQTQSIITAEWNLNTFDNIEEIGNYRYRPNDNASSFYTLPATFTKETSYSNTAKYYGATDADVVIDGGYDQNEVQLFVTQPSLKNKFYYSLEDCFNRFRPRSGINKAVFPGDSKSTKFGHFLTENLAQRPRYYVANKNDIFKYWTSYRTEVVDNKTVSRGYSKESAGGSNGYYIEDSVPFVVYKNSIACNRIIVKMQTHVGEPTSPVTIGDPFTGDASVPKNWNIDVLDSANNWTTAITLDSYTIRKDGYVELVYGPVIPTNYQEIFVHAGSYSDAGSLPIESINGYAYLIESTNEYHIWLDSISAYDTFPADLEWQTTESVIERVKPYVTNFVAVSSPTNPYATIKGVRVAVETMKRQNISFDLIEISPRLAADLTDKTIGFSIDKKAGDLASTGIPSGDILASTGSVSIFDYDQAFDKGNNSSIIKDISFKNLQFKFYQKIINVSGIDYIIPLKTMYVDGFPETSYAERTIDISLRDLFFYFESTVCPPLFLRNKSLKYIICLLMDAIGFSNYDFKYVTNERDVIIPNFYVGPDKSLAEVLQDLARSTQSSIFFDENNNLVLLSKRYMMPENSSIRATDLILAGSPDQVQQNVYDNQAKPNTQISNIIQLEAENHEIYNAGKIVFSNKYIQKNVEDLDQVGRLDYEKTYTYQPVLLWELSSANSSQTLETTSSNSGSYTLSAVPLNTNLSGQPPYISNGIVVNNTINVGEMVYWLNNYSGYLMANGEIIKYDAKEYSIAGVAGSVWIANESDRQYYFSKVLYGGQMQPTGNIRIHTEVAYDSDGNITEIIRHGRGQFGTNIVAHNAGLDDSWRTNIAGAAMDFDYLTGKKKFLDAGPLYNPGLSSVMTNNVTSQINLPAGKGLISPITFGFYEDDRSYAAINGIIGNYLSSAYVSNIEYKTSTQNIMGAVQSSALIFTGTKLYDRAIPLNFISYSYKTLGTVPNKVGTRMRIMGQQTTNKNMSQMPFGEMTYLASQQLEADNRAEVLNVSGASGGIAVHVNPKNNSGYYFEIAALSSYTTPNDSNVWFYKLTRKGYPTFISSTGFSATNDPDNPNILVSTTNGGIWSDVKRRTDNTAVSENGINVGDRIVVPFNATYQSGYFKVVDKGSATTPWKLERDELAIPKVLFQAKSDILVDYTTLVGSSRITPAIDVPIYDLRVETVNGENGSLIFYLYINDALIGIARDTDSDAQDRTSSTIALFGRGTSKCMFEHVYGISEDTVIKDIPKVYGMGEITTSNYFKKYRLSEPMIINYLSNIKNTGPQSKIFYDEFGTILRECAYFNIRYDKAYPALLAQVANTFNPFVGYYVSNFTPTPYGAEFMLFNTTDAPLIMNSSTGNYLRINGITFTAESNEELTVDEYFDLINDYSQYSSSGLPKNTSNIQNDLSLIKNSRNIYGKKEFSIESPYIQGRDMAYDMMGWMIQKIKKPKLAVSVDVFGLPIIQLGDIIEIDYQSNNNIDIPRSSRFVVYCINHSANDSEISQKIYLSEVA